MLSTESKGALAGEIYCNIPSFSYCYGFSLERAGQSRKAPRGSTSLGFNSSSIWKLLGLSLWFWTLAAHRIVWGALNTDTWLCPQRFSYNWWKAGPVLVVKLTGGSNKQPGLRITGTLLTLCWKCVSLKGIQTLALWHRRI